MTTCKICEQGQLQRIEDDFYDYITGKRFEIWSCAECDSKQTRGDVQGNFYGQAYYGSAAGKFSSLLEPVFTANHRRNARAFYHRFHPQTVLEIGCGRAYMLSALKQQGCKVRGLESANAAEWILNNPQVPVDGISDDQQWPIEENSIDLVIIWHVLEHVTDPVATIADIKRVLSARGVLCISVPNVASLQAGISLRNWFHLDVPRHLFHFTPKGLEQLLAAANLQVINKESGDFLQNLYGWIQSLSNRLTPAHNNLLYRFIQGGEPWKSCENKKLLLVQLLALPLTVPAGILGWVIEGLLNRPGSMTYFVTKR